ncbi:hypothetical protein EPN83_01950 [Patescibacteria group bacterium]|nr:MAG: hypothetical protein EPN83_01950 [Patescibacteria group bacterium]
MDKNVERGTNPEKEREMLTRNAKELFHELERVYIFYRKKGAAHPEQIQGIGNNLIALTIGRLDTGKSIDLARRSFEAAARYLELLREHPSFAETETSNKDGAFPDILKEYWSTRIDQDQMNMDPHDLTAAEYYVQEVEKRLRNPV